MMKKTRPNSVSALPLHQFKDKPISSSTAPLSATGSLPGGLNLRKVILGAGGILFVYILLSTFFGPGPAHDSNKAPSALRPETDPYVHVPIDNVTPHRYDNQDSKPPAEYGDNKDERNPWGSPSEEKKPAPAESGSESDDDTGLKGSPPTVEEEVEQQVPPPPTTNNNSGESEDEGEEEDDEELTEEEETLLTLAIKNRENSPASYVDLLSANRRERDYAIALIVKEADQALKSEKVYSVVNKNQVAPSGDIHDYLSLSKYYWPNPNTPNNLPYIRKDGHVNHKEIDSVEDYKMLRAMIREVHMMGMAYHFTGDKAYMRKCVARLNEWFFDEETYMKPNINYGSLQKGQKLGVRTGVLDMFTIFRVFDALHYLKQDAEWPQDMIPNLQKWFTEYVAWLETSSLAILERKGNNNHGTYYDVQLIGIYLFLDRTDDARAVAESALTNRIDRQITAEGRQPDELARKTSWYYSVFNLQAMMTLARWGDDLGVNMWDYEGPKGQSIKKAIDFLLPYSLTGGKDWPVTNIDKFPMGDYLKCLQIAWNIYGDEKYLEAIKFLRPKIQELMDAGSLKQISTYMCDMSTLLEAGVRGGQGFIWHWCIT